jgi:type IV secretion system protein VirB2
MGISTVGVTGKTLNSAAPSPKGARTMLQTFVAMLILTASSDGFCQLTNATGKITALSTWLAGLALTVFTIALLYVGYKCIFAGAAFRDMWNILLGGFLVGGAAGLAAFVAA